MKKNYLSPDLSFIDLAVFEDIITISIGGSAGEIGEEKDGVGIFR